MPVRCRLCNESTRECSLSTRFRFLRNDKYDVRLQSSALSHQFPTIAVPKYGFPRVAGRRKLNTRGGNLDIELLKLLRPRSRNRGRRSCKTFPDRRWLIRDHAFDSEAQSLAITRLIGACREFTFTTPSYRNLKRVDRRLQGVDALTDRLHGSFAFRRRFCNCGQI